MGLFSKLFKKEKINTNTNFITTGKIFIYKPNEDFYHENKNEIKTYERVYQAKLNQNRTLTSLDLKLEDDKYLHHYINKLTKINLEIDFIIDPLNQSDKKEHTYLSILEEKQKLYHTLIVNHINNLFLKKAALENILKRNPFMSMNKKNTIKNLISQIEIQIISMQNAITGNLLEITTLKDRIESLNLPKEENQVTLNRYKKIIEGFDINLSEITPVSIAKATVQIEDEIYNDSHLANSISEDLTKLLSSNLSSKEQLKQLDKLIAKCIGIEELGYQKLENLKEKLFKTKFNILCNLAISNDYKGISFDSFFKEEQANLETVLLNLINVISKDPSRKIYGSYQNVSKENNGTMRINEYERLVRLSKQIITNDSGEFSASDIFNTPFKLALLASISSPELITSFFDNYMVKSRNIYKYINDLKAFDFSDQIPLSTFMSFLSNEIEVPQNGTKPEIITFMKSNPSMYMQSSQKLYALVQLYSLIFKTILNTKNNREIPNGVEYISDDYATLLHTPVLIYYSEIFKPFIERLKYDNTPIEFPSSLNRINLDVFSKMYYEVTFDKLINLDLKLKFNEGLKEFISTREMQFDTIEFPSTIKKISLSHPPHDWVFNNYLDCEALETQEGFIELLKECDMTEALFLQQSKFHFNYPVEALNFTVDTKKIPRKELKRAIDYSNKDYIFKVYKLFVIKLKEIYTKLENYAKALGIEINHQIKLTYKMKDIYDLYQNIVKKASSINLPSTIISEYKVSFQKSQNNQATKDDVKKHLQKLEILVSLGLIDKNKFKSIVEEYFNYAIASYESSITLLNDLSPQIAEIIKEIMKNKISNNQTLSYENIDQEELLKKKLTSKAITRNDALRLEAAYKSLFFTKDENNIQDGILNNQILLKFYNVLNYPNPLERIIKLFQKIKIKNQDCTKLLKEITYDEHFCDEIPLLTLLKLIDSVPQDKRLDVLGESLYKIYNFYNVLSPSLVPNEKEFILPGIKVFRMKPAYNNPVEQITIYKLRKYKPSTITLPNGLSEIILDGPTSFNGDISAVNKIILNKEIDHLYILNHFSCSSNLTVEIPTELKSFTIFRINHSRDVTITFNDYENSKILNDKTALNSFLRQYIGNITAFDGFTGKSIRIVLAKPTGEQIPIESSIIREKEQVANSNSEQIFNDMKAEIKKYLPQEKNLNTIKK
mgnify:FL=1